MTIERRCRVRGCGRTLSPANVTGACLRCGKRENDRRHRVASSLALRRRRG